MRSSTCQSSWASGLTARAATPTGVYEAMVKGVAVAGAVSVGRPMFNGAGNETVGRLRTTSAHHSPR